MFVAPYNLTCAINAFKMCIRLWKNIKNLSQVRLKMDQR